jgi:outer membrane protein insertion porin family
VQPGRDLIMSGESVKPMKTKLLLSLLVLSIGLLGASPCFSQNMVIREVRVEGLDRVSEATVRQAIQIETGQDLMRSDVQMLLRQDVKELARVEGVENITVSTEPVGDGGIRLIFEISEYPVIEDIRFSGNRKYDDGRLQKELGFIRKTGILKMQTEQVETFYSPTKVRQYLNILENLYQEKGFAGADIEQSVRRRGRDAVILEFDIQEGKKQTIQGIKFVGNESFRDKKIIKEAKLQAKKAFLPIFPKAYEQFLVDEDMQRIKRFYEDRGFYRVEVQQLESEQVKDGRGVIIVYEVNEGGVYHFAEVQMSGNRVFSDEELLEGIYSKPEARFSRTELEKDTFELSEMYREQGMLYTQVQPLLSAQDEARQVNISWSVTESPRYRLGDIQIEGVVGLEDGTIEQVPLKTKDKVILREITLDKGEVLDWSEVRRSEKNLLNLGYFKRMEDMVPAKLKYGMQPEPVEGATDTLDLRVRLEEEPTGLVTFGAGFSTTTGASIFASVTERNLFGRGWRGTLSGTVGTRQISLQSSFHDPHFMDSDYSLGIDAYRRYRESFGGREFDETRTGGSVQVGRQLARDFRGYVRYKFEQIEIGDIDRGGLRDTVRPDVYVEDTSTTSSITVGLIHDTRDYYANPSSGHRYAGSFELAGLGGENEFWKLLLNASWYRHLGGKLILAQDLESNWAQGWGGTEDLPLHERFFAGGANSIRGFEEGGIGPRGVYAVTRRLADGTIYNDIDDVVIGGQVEVLSRTELRYQFTDIIMGVVFLDAGSVWAEYDDIDLGQIRVSTGVGLRVNLPIGAAVRLDFGIPLKKESEDDTQFFHFGFNQSF